MKKLNSTFCTIAGHRLNCTYEKIPSAKIYGLEANSNKACRPPNEQPALLYPPPIVAKRFEGTDYELISNPTTINKSFGTIPPMHLICVVLEKYPDINNRRGINFTAQLPTAIVRELLNQVFADDALYLELSKLNPRHGRSLSKKEIKRLFANNRCKKTIGREASKHNITLWDDIDD